jgi:hypothetical protein
MSSLPPSSEDHADDAPDAEDATAETPQRRVRIRRRIDDRLDGPIGEEWLLRQERRKTFKIVLWFLAATLVLGIVALLIPT